MQRRRFLFGVAGVAAAAPGGRIRIAFLGVSHGTIHTSIAPAMRLELARFRGGQMFELG